MVGQWWVNGESIVGQWGGQWWVNGGSMGVNGGSMVGQWRVNGGSTGDQWVLNGESSMMGQWGLAMEPHGLGKKTYVGNGGWQ